MLPARRRLVVVCLASGALLVGAAGCSKSAPQNEAMSGSGSSSGHGIAASAQLLSDSAVKTAKGTGKFEITMTSLGTARGDVESVKGNGQYDNAKKQFQMTMDLSGYAEQIGSSAGVGSIGDQLFSDPIEMIGDGDSVYAKSPFLNAMLGGGSKPWVKFSAKAETGKTPGNAMSNIVPFAASAGGGATPFLNSLQGAAGEVQDVGGETIDGVQTRHLKATIDPDKLKAKGVANQFGDQQYPVDVWVDSEGVVHRIQYEIDPKIALGNFGGLGGLGEINSVFGGDDGAGLGKSLRITMDIRDAGQPVDIQLPPADEVSESAGVPSIPGGGGGGGLPPIPGNRSTTTR